MKFTPRRRGHKRGRRRVLARWTPRAVLRRTVLRMSVWGVRLMVWGVGLAIRRALRSVVRAALGITDDARRIPEWPGSGLAAITAVGKA